MTVNDWKQLATYALVTWALLRGCGWLTAYWICGCAP